MTETDHTLPSKVHFSSTQGNIAVREESKMNDWSPEAAMAMERLHILEGENRVERQEALVKKLIEQGHDRIVARSKEVLGLLRDSLELSRERLRDLENRYGMKDLEST